MGKPNIKINSNIDLGNGFSFDLALKFNALEEVEHVNEAKSESIKSKARKPVKPRPIRNKNPK